MTRKHLADTILDQAQKHADTYQRPLGDILLNYWYVAQQYLHQLDPHATNQIQENLAKLMHNELTPETFSDLTQASVDDIVMVVDIHHGLVPVH